MGILAIVAVECDRLCGDGVDWVDCVFFATNEEDENRARGAFSGETGYRNWRNNGSVDGRYEVC